MLGSRLHSDIRSADAIVKADFHSRSICPSRGARHGVVSDAGYRRVRRRSGKPSRRGFAEQSRETSPQSGNRALQCLARAIFPERSLNWVKLRRTQYEQISSGLPLTADITQYIQSACLKGANTGPAAFVIARSTTWIE